MRNRKPSGRASSWLTARQLADALDISNDYARREVVRTARPEWVRRDGRKIKVYGRGVIAHWLRPDSTTVAEVAIDQQLADDSELSLFMDDPPGMDLDAITTSA